MAARTALAAVSFSLKTLIKANRKTANALCWITVCCSVKGECLSCRCQIHIWSFLWPLNHLSVFKCDKIPMAINTINIICYHFCSFSKGYVTWRQHNSSASPKAPPPQLSLSRRIVGHYDRLVECGTLRENVHQKYVIQQLAQLQHTLKNYSNSMYLSLLKSTINSNDDKSHLTLHKDCHFMPSENKSGGTINKVQYLLSSYIKF